MNSEEKRSMIGVILFAWLVAGIIILADTMRMIKGFQDEIEQLEVEIEETRFERDFYLNLDRKRNGLDTIPNGGYEE